VKVSRHSAAMHKPLLRLALLAVMLGAAPPALAQASAAQAAGRTAPSPLAPSEIVAAAPRADWTAIAASDLLVMDLAPDAKGKPRRVVIQLMPKPFSEGWIGNIRKLAAAHWWDGLSINRVQDNYVVQWGDAEAEDKAKARALPEVLVVVPETEYATPLTDVEVARFRTAIVIGSEDAAASAMALAENKTIPTVRDNPLLSIYDAYGTTMLSEGWAWSIEEDAKSPVHCYGMVGVGRDMPPNTGTGAELYTVIGHAPRHLDRNIALVGRVIEGIEHLSSLPRGTGGLGFYETAAERTTITAIRIGTEVAGLPAYEYLSTESTSFAKYADARANRRDAFFIRPAGGADICNIPVPVRRVK